MSETEPEAQAAATASAPVADDKTYYEILKALLGRVVTIANPESYEEGGLGYKIETGFYKGKLTGIGKDHVVVLTEFVHGTGKNATKEPVKQFIPIARIKRVSLMKTDRILHL